MHYRLCRPDDFHQLYALEKSCFQPPLRFSRTYLERLIQNPRSATWIAEDDGIMAGFAIVDWTDQPASERVAYVETLEVSPAHRGRGIASGLLRRAEASAQSAGAMLIWLHVESTNHPAIRLYRAHGYRHRGSEGHYYARGRNADIYSKPLVP